MNHKANGFVQILTGLMQQSWNDKMNKTTRHMMIGIVGIFAVVFAVTWQALNNAPGKMSSSYSVIGEFRNAEGLPLGAKVSLSGIEIGTVSDVSYNPDHQTVLVSLAINNDVELSTDTLGMIVSDGFFGNKYIKIIPGGMPDMLREGDFLEYVQDSVNLKELLELVVRQASLSDAPSD